MHVSVTISPVRDRHGHIIGASKTARDITARKEWEGQLLRSEEALRRNRDVLKLAMSTAQMGAWTRDLVLDTVWWSPEFAELFGIVARRYQLRSRVACSARSDPRIASGCRP